MSQQIVFHVDKHKFLEEISCTRRNFILWWFFYRKKIPSHEEICFTHRNFLSRKKFTFQGKKSFTRRYCIAKTSLFNWKSRKLIYPMGKTVWTEERSRNLSFHINIHKEDSFYLMSNYRYFSGFWCIWLPLFWAKFLPESIGSHEVKYFIPPWVSQVTILPKLNPSFIELELGLGFDN